MKLTKSFRVTHASVRNLIVMLASCVFLAAAADYANATTLCARKKLAVKSGKVSLGKSVISVEGSCPKGYVTIVDIATIQGEKGNKGETGDVGLTGSDGSLRIYGDGSAGARVVSTNKIFAAGDIVSQYTNFTVDTGATLTIPSGTVIRCSEKFTNNGTIIVSGWKTGGKVQGGGAKQDLPSAPGVAPFGATRGEIGDSTAIRFGGAGGTGLSSAQVAQLRYPGFKGGGGGSAGYPGTSNALSSISPDGGGTLVVLAKDAILNTGEIRANGSGFGSGGHGGSAGGVIILASPVSVTNTGTVNALGANGANSTSHVGPGGGGGGGILSIISPVINESGTVTLTGGSPGTVGGAGSVTTSPRTGGGGGGACGGDGGSGGNVNSSGDPIAGLSGGTGISSEILEDPTGLF